MVAPKPELGVAVPFSGRPAGGPCDGDEWVVTYRFYYEGGNFGIEEYFRGSERECRRIALGSVAPGSTQRGKVIAFDTVIGRASEWDEFIRSELQR